MLAGINFYQAPQETPLIGVSACLTGELVRYDGGHKQQHIITTLLARHARLWPVCPEAGAGLGIPRPPIRIVQDGTEKRVEIIESGHDVSEILRYYAEHVARARPPHLHGFIVKSRSPSCGLGSTPIHDSQANILNYGDGLFTQTLRARWPDCLFVDEEQLSDTQACAELLLRCYLLQELKAAKDSDNTRNLLAHYQPHFTGVLDKERWQALLLDAHTPLYSLLQA